MNIKLFAIVLLTVLLFSCKKKSEQKQEGLEPQLSQFYSKEFVHPETVFYDSGRMVSLKGGSYTPLYGKKDSAIAVADFMMDEFPVTNKQFLNFVKFNPQWQKLKVKRIYADGNYLKGWKSDTALSVDQNPDAPATNVSWFAANAYCKCMSKQLPTIDQWEYAASSDADSKDARKEKSYNQFILSWYEKQNTYNNAVGQTFKNYWGIWDLHGLIWEWTLDYNTVMLSGESRRDVTNDNSMFCGSGSVGATDLMNYAAFMRYAFRASMKANYAVQNQGFRCVKNKKLK
jgi:formylglycine-generating enzyme required for sulfatase activity